MNLIFPGDGERDSGARACYGIKTHRPGYHKGETVKLITYRSGYDWACYNPEMYYQLDCPIGYSKTEFDAIVDFVRELLLRNDDAQEMLVNCAPGQGAEYDASLHFHTCQQCGKRLSTIPCDCDTPKDMNWCSPNCYAAWQL